MKTDKEKIEAAYNALFEADQALRNVLTCDSEILCNMVRATEFDIIYKLTIMFKNIVTSGELDKF